MTLPELVARARLQCSTSHIKLAFPVFHRVFLVLHHSHTSSAISGCCTCLLLVLHTHTHTQSFLTAAMPQTWDVTGELHIVCR
jgi:hypothetical protein